MHRRSLLAISLLAAAALAGSSLAACARPRGTPVQGGRIAFTSTRDGNEEIYVMNADGSHPANLTNSPGGDWGPAWSPDGRRIAFTSTRDGNEEIYVMNADGSGLARLTNDPADDAEPAWSPDGQRIAFESWRDGDKGIDVMNADGSHLANLADRPGEPAWWPQDGSRPAGPPAEDEQPTWSPDGARIAFLSDRFDGRSQELYVMNADGSGQPALAADAACDALSPDCHASLAWSPDGRRLAFVSQGAGGTEIHVMDADGSHPASLTNNLGHGWRPAWSPDGAHIAFLSSYDYGCAVHVMDADGSGRTRLTGLVYDPGAPQCTVSLAWSPDGARIAFDALRDGARDIYVINADGSGETRLTDEGGTQPAWAPE